MARLNGSSANIELAPGGYSLQAPGVHGEVFVLEKNTAATTTRSQAESGPYEELLDLAARENGVSTLKAFAFDIDSVDKTAADATRSDGLETAEGEPAMALRVPDIEPDTDYAVLQTDEFGVSRWIFPANRQPTTSAATRGGGGDILFLLPSLPAQEAPDAPSANATRGRLTKLGRRLVRVLAWATEDLIGAGAIKVAKSWESKKRPYGLRRFPFDDSTQIPWSSMRSGERALLLIHGTFSTAQGGFGQIPPSTVDELKKIYGDRMFAFDHPSVHVTPEDNAREFFNLLPDGTNVEVDIITHSRGGLVGRELAERTAMYATANRALKVRRAVFVAAPMRGTILTDSRHGIRMLDRYTNLFTSLPDNPFTIGMEAIFMLVKLVYHGSVTALPGLRSMFPPGDYLRSLNQGADHGVRYHAIGANFTPKGESMLARFGWTVANAAVDGIFGEHNDGVVPTDGSYDVKTTIGGFPIPDANRMIFDRDAGIHHCNYFTSDEANRAVVRWLS